MLRDKIIVAFHEVAEIYNAGLTQLEDDTILLDCGLDSLAFAALVAKLEEDLGYDPFALSPNPVYPQTFSEFVRVYEQFSLDPETE